MSKRRDMAGIGDEIRVFADEMSKLAHTSRAYSVIQPIVANAVDHLLLRARWSDQLQAKPKEIGDA